GNGLRRNADDSGTWRDVPGDDSVGANTRALADLDRPQHLRARANDHAVVQAGMPLSANTLRRVGAAERHVLVNGDVVADLGRFANHAEAMVEKEALADPGTRMDVDAGQETREVVHQPGNEIELSFPQPVRGTVHA